MGCIYLPFRGRERTHFPGVVYSGWRSGWLTGFKFRKAIPASRASGAVSNYQMRLVINRSLGTDAAGTIYVGDRCASDYSDIRFTNPNGTTLLDYWIESSSSTTATVWIELDSVATSSFNYYFYCGATASSLSSGANTFIAFDDFERGSDGDTIGGNWTETAAHAHISTEQKYGGSRSAKFVGAASASNASLPLSPSTDQSIYLHVYKEAACEEAGIYHGNGTKRTHILITIDGSICYFAGSTQTDTNYNINLDQWNLIELNNFNWTSYTNDIWLNGTKIKSGAAMETSVGTSNIILLLGAGSATKDIYFDNVIVHNWRSTEPAWGTPGAWESA